MSNSCLARMGALCLALLLSPGARAAGTGSVAGKITDEKGQPVVEATVLLKSADSDRQCTAKTDKNGDYHCAGLPPGRYEMSVTHKTFSLKMPSAVPVHDGPAGDPKSPEFQNRFDVDLAAIQKRNEEIKKAEEEFAKVRAGFERAVAFNREGKFAEAVAELEPAAQQEPNLFQVHAQLGVAYSGLKRLEEAAASYEKAVQLKPDDARLYNNLGEVYARLRRYEDARKQFETAARLSPLDAAMYYFNLGITLFNANDLKAAVEPFRKTLELDPAYPAANYFLGVCLYNNAEFKQEGNEIKTILLPGTRESFQRYLELEPAGQYVDAAKQMLQVLDATVPAAVRVRKKR